MSEDLIVEGLFPPGRLHSEDIPEMIAALPQKLHPSHFGDAERATRSPDHMISDEAKWSAFLRDRPGGFWLYGKRFKINITIFDSIRSQIAFWAKTNDKRFQTDSVAILELMAKSGAFYAFAVSWSEYVERNHLHIDYIDGGSCESFCGRDTKRYVPGLYWLNFFSTQYIEEMEIDVDAIAKSLSATVAKLPSGLLLRLYDDPMDWVNRNNDVADVIHQTRNFFSMRNVEVPTSPKKIEMMLSDDTPYTRWP